MPSPRVIAENLISENQLDHSARVAGRVEAILARNKKIANPRELLSCPYPGRCKKQITAIYEDIMKDQKKEKETERSLGDASKETDPS